MKIGSLAGEELNTAPEFEDCRTAALSIMYRSSKCSRLR